MKLTDREEQITQIQFHSFQPDAPAEWTVNGGRI